MFVPPGLPNRFDNLSENIQFNCASWSMLKLRLFELKNETGTPKDVDPFSSLRLIVALSANTYIYVNH